MVGVWNTVLYWTVRAYQRPRVVLEGFEPLVGWVALGAATHRAHGEESEIGRVPVGAEVKTGENRIFVCFEVVGRRVKHPLPPFFCVLSC